AGLGRRALSGSGADVPLAVAFGCFVVVLMLATLQRPSRASVWIALALTAGVYVATARALAETPFAMAAFFAVAALATWRTASHLRAFTVAAFALWTPALDLFASPDVAVLPAPVLIAAMFALGDTVLVLVDPSRVHPSDRLRRLGFGIVAIAVMAALFDRHLAVGSSGLAAATARRDRDRARAHDLRPGGARVHRRGPVSRRRRRRAASVGRALRQRPGSLCRVRSA